MSVAFNHEQLHPAKTWPKVGRNFGGNGFFVDNPTKDLLENIGIRTSFLGNWTNRVLGGFKLMEINSNLISREFEFVFWKK